MVDKVDKPERPSPYAVGGTTETKRDKPREERGQEDLPTFKQKAPSLYQEKFQGETGPLKTVKVPLEQIEKLLFRRATPRHGIPTAEADLVWKDGRTTEEVSFLLHHWQDFLKIKNLKTGQPIPPEFWNREGKELSITIRQHATSGPWNLREIQKQNEAPLATPSWRLQLKKDPWTFVLYGLAVLVFLGVIIFLARM